MRQKVEPKAYAIARLESRTSAAIFILFGVCLLCPIAHGAGATASSQPATESQELQVENEKLRDEVRFWRTRSESDTQEIIVLSKRWLDSVAIHKERTPSTNPVTPEAGKYAMVAARVRSQSNLKLIGAALLMYANAHDQKGPATLEQLRVAADIPTASFQSPLLNCRYQYLGYANNMNRNEVVAYEDSDDPYRNILFGDGSVVSFRADEAAKIIADHHK